MTLVLIKRLSTLTVRANNRSPGFGLVFFLLFLCSPPLLPQCLDHLGEAYLLGIDYLGALKTCLQNNFFVELRSSGRIMVEVQCQLGASPGELASQGLLSEIDQLRRSRLALTWISSALIIVLLGLVVILILNLKKIKKWANSTIIAKEIHIAHHQTQVETLRMRLDELQLKEKDRKWSSSPLCDDQAQVLLTRLIDLIDKEKPYLDPELSLGRLADCLEINRSYLSRVINELLGKNFNEFINDCRIDTAKKLLAERDFNNSSILNVAFEAGFNSKSAFNRVFKASTGLTPREYCKQLLIVTDREAAS